MDEKRETSTGLSSEPPSIPGLSGEKRDEDGPEEDDELVSKRAKLQQDLDSDVLAKDDDRLVANALPETETRIVRDDSNRETRGGVGVHVDDTVVSNNNSSSVVLKPTESVVVTPRDASVPHPPYQMSSALERSESVRTWMDMKHVDFFMRKQSQVA